MGLYSEKDLTNGERGQWALIHEAPELRHRKSWAGKIAFIYPVIEVLIHADDGVNPQRLVLDATVSEDAGLLLTGDEFRRRSEWTVEEPELRINGTWVDMPLVYSTEDRAFGDILHEDGKPVSRAWVPDNPDIYVLSHDSPVPHVYQDGNRGTASVSLLRVDHI